jgi:hypothetical protein
MLSQPGYYSLIQYCPDRTSLETANVGVILFCPGWSFLDARLTSSFSRLEAFFNKYEIDRPGLTATLESVRQRLLKTKNEFKTKDDLQRFVETRANEIIITPPRSIKVLEPEKELDALYRELLGRREQVRHEKQPVLPELDAIFRRPSLQQRTKFDVSIAIPLLGQVIKVPYAYQNGTLNLVQPEIFSDKEGRAIHRAERLAIEGDLLGRHPDEHGNARKLIVVMKVVDHTDDVQILHRISDLLNEYHVRSVFPEQLAQFAQEVEETAHL